jgi:hypothetical protein
VGAVGPMPVRWVFFGLFLAISAYCLMRLGLPGRRRWISSHGSGRDVDAAHVAMGLGMAAMLGPSTARVPAALGVVIFAAAAAWFVARVVLSRPGARHGPLSERTAHTHHLMAMLAMAYMMIATLAGGGMSEMSAMPGMSMSAPSIPHVLGQVVTSGLVFYFVAVIVYSGVLVARAPMRATPAAAGSGRVASAPVILSPKLEISCETVMAVGMAYMLAMML